MDDRKVYNYHNAIDVAQLVFATSGDILNNGVLCQSPFGRHMELELINRRPRSALQLFCRLVWIRGICQDGSGVRN
eukprot:SAG22_NODE_805_length_7096_cov_28.481206_3_plen_76_part_00